MHVKSTRFFHFHLSNAKKDFFVYLISKVVFDFFTIDSTKRKAVKANVRSSTVTSHKQTDIYKSIHPMLKHSSIANFEKELQDKYPNKKKQQIKECTLRRKEWLTASAPIIMCQYWEWPDYIRLGSIFERPTMNCVVADLYGTFFILFRNCQHDVCR